MKMFSAKALARWAHFLRKTVNQIRPAVLAIVGMAIPLHAQNAAITLLSQQGVKLVSGSTGASAQQGSSLSMSADGLTLLAGAQVDNSGAGGALVYTQSGGVWTQQGGELVGNNAIGNAGQGFWVALSGDGNTALIGGIEDNGGVGAAWVFTRSGGAWTQQAKLVGSGATGQANQGASVALSADGNTALIGGYNDNSGAGAVWVFTRSAGVWTQQGSKLIGTGATGTANQGSLVGLSGDGNTALVGGPNDNEGVGGVWVFARNSGVWTQQGSELIGTGWTGSPFQGSAGAISTDGNTLAAGGPSDNGNVGGVWVFTRSAGAWTQQGSELIGAGATGAAFQGGAVALADNGNILFEGGPDDNGNLGAAWEFARYGAGNWAQQGGKLIGTGSAGSPFQGANLAASASGTALASAGPLDSSGKGAVWLFSSFTAFPAADLGVSSVATITPNFNGSFVLGNIVVVTQGATNFDFTLASSQPSLNPCTIGTAYDDGPCSVNVQFVPMAIGPRYGAILFYDNSEPAVLEATVFVSGIGLGAQVGFVSGLIATILPASAGLNFPVGLGLFNFNGLFVANTVDNEIDIFSSSLTPTIIAGNGTGGYTGDGGLASQAELNTPENLVFDGAGTLYFADQQNNVIRSINAFSGIIETVAGNGTGGYGGDGGPATSAELQAPAAVAVDAAGNLYIADTGNQEVRMVQAGTGQIFTIAGTAGVSGYTGDGGPATSAELSSPLAVALDSAGNLYFCDDGNAVVRRVDANTGIITTVAGTGTAGFLGDGGPATSAEFQFPTGLALDSAASIYIADSGNNRIRKVSGATGTVQTIVGSSTVGGYTGDGGPATQAQLNFPSSPLVDVVGDILFADSGNNVVRIAGTVAGLSFGTVNIFNTSSAQDVTVTNNGNIPLVFSSVGSQLDFNLSGADTTCFSSGTLNPGESCVLGIEFAPLTPGSLNEVITLVDNGGTQTVPVSGTGALNTTAITLASSMNPSPFGQSVTFTATVNPPPVQPDVVNSPSAKQHRSRSALPPTSLGTASFYYGATLLNTAPVNFSGIATFATSSLPVGSDAMTVVYSGDYGFAGSTSTIFTEVITSSGTATTTTLAAMPNPAALGQPVTLTANIFPIPTGSNLGLVSFIDGGVLLETGAVNSSGVASISISNLSAGAHNLTAVYTGNTGFGGSTSSVVTETIASTEATATGTALTVSPNPATAGQAVVITATVSPSPTGSSLGTVSFYDGSTLIGMEAVNSSGVATLSLTTLPVGSDALMAVYSGNSGFSPSTSSPVTEVVNTAYTVMAPATPVPVAQGGSVQIDVTVPPLGGAYDNLVTMSASGLPPGATATFNPPTVTPGASGAPTTLTIQLAAVAAAMIPSSPSSGRSDPWHHLWPLAGLALTLGLCAAGVRANRSAVKPTSTGRRRPLRLVLPILAFLMSSGCGGGWLGPPTTQPGSFVVTITGTSGSLSASTTVTVVVR